MQELGKEMEVVEEGNNNMARRGCEGKKEDKGHNNRETTSWERRARVGGRQTAGGERLTVVGGRQQHAIKKRDVVMAWRATTDGERQAGSGGSGGGAWRRQP